MFKSSSKLRSLKRDRGKANDSSSMSNQANNIAIRIDRDKTSIKNRLDESIFVENMDFLEEKIRKINQQAYIDIKSAKSYHPRLIQEIRDDIEREEYRLSREDD